MKSSRIIRCLSIVAAVIFAAPLLALDDPPLRNWAVPRGAGGSHLSALADIGNPSPFVSVAPCRIVDTRGGAPLGGGVGPFTSGQTRNYDLNSAAAPCDGIPAGTAGYSVNVTVTNDTGPGYVAAYPTGNRPNPIVSLLNYTTAAAVANAAIVPCDAAGSITVENQGGTADIIIDINGYFLGSGTANGAEYFQMTTTGSYAAYFSTSGGNDAIHVQCTGANACWGIHALVSGTGYSGNFSGGAGLYSTVSAANSEGVEGYSTAGNGGLFTTGATSGQYGGVVGKATAAVTDNFFVPSGVRGIGGNIGTLGLSTNFGVVGARVDGTGALVTASYLGRDSTVGLYTIGNTSATGTKNFIEPHPTDATKAIRYTSLEGPEAGTYFRGRGRFVDRHAVIESPEDFRLVTDADGLSIQVTPIGELASVAVVSIDTDRVVLKSSRDVEFFFTVNGVRKAFKDMPPIIDSESYFMPESPNARMPLGFSDEQKRILISNGTYNADGTVNMRNADRAGWTRIWKDRESRLNAEMERARAQRVEPQHD